MLSLSFYLVFSISIFVVFLFFFFLFIFLLFLLLLYYYCCACFYCYLFCYYLLCCYCCRTRKAQDTCVRDKLHKFAYLQLGLTWLEIQIQIQYE